MANELLTAKILQDYPSLAFLLNDPEIGPLLLEAVNPEGGLSPAAFQAKLAQTTWWKTSSASQRQYETLLNTDPAAAAQKKDEWKASVSQQAALAGVKLEGVDLDWWADYFMPRGLMPGDPRLQTQIAQVYATRPDLRMAGNIAATGAQLKQIAAKYFFPLAESDLTHWETQIAAGRSSVQAFEQEMQRQAAERFPTLSQQILAGSTPDQLFTVQRNAIANELEIDPSSMDLMSDPRWSKILGVTDEKGGTRPMTYNESIQYARSQDEWKRTANGQKAGADLTMTLLKELGAVA